MGFIFENFVHLLKRFRVPSIINIVGLSLAFAVFIIIGIQTCYDATFNRQFTKSDNIYNFSRYYPSDGIRISTISVPVAESMVQEFSEINNYCLLQSWDENSFDIYGKDNKHVTHTENLVFTTSGFLDIFTPEIILGDVSKTLEIDNRALISESVAKKIFGDQNPVGQVIYDHFSQQPITIDAVYKDFPENCSLTNGIYTKLVDYNQNNWAYKGYFELLPGTYTQLQEKLNGAEFRGEATLKAQDEDPTIREDYELTPLTDLHLNQNTARKTLFLSLIAIGVVILVIVYTNYINFSIAMASSRIRNINIHKILGIHKMLLRISILFEGLFLTLISFMLALLYLYFFQKTTLSSLFDADLSFDQNIFVISAVGVILLFLSFLVGLYPTKYVTSFNEAVALNASFALSPRGVKLRNVLITIQFTAAMVLIVVSSFMQIQNKYMQNYSIGIQKENIVYLPVAGLKTDLKTFAEELNKNPNVKGFTASEHLPGYIGMSWNRNFEGQFLQKVVAWSVTPDFLDFFGVDILAGNNFTKNDTIGQEQIIFNEKFLEKYGLDKSIVGKDFECFNPGIIVGIAKDINFQSLHYAIEPMGYVVLNDQKGWIKFMYIKISGQNTPETIDYIEKTWSKFNDETFDLNFLDSKMNDLYKKEENQSKLITLFGFITIVIAVMGVYGLILFNTRQKNKQIAIRKINGASEAQIVFMLNKDLLLLLFIAFLIAMPVAYYFVGKWLENFAYKTPIYYWVFFASGFLVFLITIATVSIQSWRAAKANPVDSLKTE
ncbi:ABC transporter permease [Dysgonomonas sp. ZJ279]|uniref:ABC transporter permease n=1 Tax=Dysgonomonas sp. ZJ279 TaxID=2709796 RepID=UPI0013EDF5E0|nr:ABC transporter permease [Dysgonomonas sp. ZJ279]